MDNKILVVAFLGFATMCFLLIGVHNLDMFKESPQTVVIPIVVGVILGVLFGRAVKKL